MKRKFLILSIIMCSLILLSGCTNNNIKFDQIFDDTNVLNIKINQIISDIDILRDNIQSIKNKIIKINQKINFKKNNI